MLNMKFTRIFNTETRSVVPSAAIHEEGIALVEAIDAGETKVMPSTGAAGEIFAGVSLSRNVPPTMMPNVEEGLVPASLSVKLARIPMAGQLLVKAAGDVLTIVSAAPAAGEVQVAGDILVFNAAQANAALSAQYMYEPTVTEARTLVGDAPIGGLSSSAQHVIGVVVKGEFATNMFDASVDWSDVMQVKLGPNGIFTTTGPGAVLHNVVVRNRPSSANSMLVLAIN